MRTLLLIYRSVIVAVVITHSFILYDLSRDSVDLRHAGFVVYQQVQEITRTLRGLQGLKDVGASVSEI